MDYLFIRNTFQCDFTITITRIKVFNLDFTKKIIIANTIKYKIITLFINSTH